MSNKIKLILCDLDGTILDSSKQVPTGFDHVFQQLQKKGIALGMATGRPYANIKLKFKEAADQMSCVAENGGCVTYQGKLIHSEHIEKKLCDSVVHKCRILKNCGAVLCALNATYIENREEHMIAACQEYYPNLIIVDDLLAVEDEIVKISVRDFIDSKIHTGPAFANFDVRLDSASSDKHWLDIMNKGVSKSKGMDILCARMGITADQVMAFGDEMNDYELLSKVTYSYAMGNAVDQIKNVCRYVCESNDNDGVMKTIKSVFSLE